MHLVSRFKDETSDIAGFRDEVTICRLMMILRHSTRYSLGTSAYLTSIICKEYGILGLWLWLAHLETAVSPKPLEELHIEGLLGCVDAHRPHAVEQREFVPFQHFCALCSVLCALYGTRVRYQSTKLKQAAGTLKALLDDSHSRRLIIEGHLNDQDEW